MRLNRYIAIGNLESIYWKHSCFSVSIMTYILNHGQIIKLIEKDNGMKFVQSSFETEKSKEQLDL